MPNLVSLFHCLRCAQELSNSEDLWYVSTLCKLLGWEVACTSHNLPSWRTIPRRLSASTYSVHSQLRFISGRRSSIPIQTTPRTAVTQTHLLLDEMKFELITRHLKTKHHPCLTMVALWLLSVSVVHFRGYSGTFVAEGLSCCAKNSSFCTVNTRTQTVSQIVTAWSSTAGGLWTTVQPVPISWPVISIFSCTTLRKAGLRILCNKCRP